MKTRSRYPAQRGWTKEFLRKGVAVLLSLCGMCVLANAEPEKESGLQAVPADPKASRYFSFEEATVDGKTVAKVTFIKADGEIDEVVYYDGSTLNTNLYEIYDTNSDDLIFDSVFETKGLNGLPTLGEAIEEISHFHMWMPFDLNFQGGSLSELSSAIESSYIRSLDQAPDELGKYISVLSKDAISFEFDSVSVYKFPAIQARAISLKKAFEIVGNLTRYYVHGDVSLDFNDQGLSSLTVKLPDDHDPLDFGLKIFNIKELSESFSPDLHEHVVSAMESAWQSNGLRAVNAKVSYHAATGLLMINSDDYELAEAEMVFNALRSANGTSKETTLGDLEAELSQLRKVIENLK